MSLIFVGPPAPARFRPRGCTSVARRRGSAVARLADLVSLGLVLGAAAAALLTLIAGAVLR